MNITDILVSELQESARVVPDPEFGPKFLAVDGMVDVGAIAAHVLEYAAHVVDTYRTPGGRNGTRAALPYEVRDHLRALASAARSGEARPE
ncbi:hypothetical protein [Curtobacterium sp. PhB136]|uniref:hypothetical protein n=1 Tax=Curtobacterium sp. PhB136 TaxID=2485181 RepID=UPI001048F980|nr:hypothetical protein [Curtobacterium sp. PhB136]TCK63144.1 hypothetical protein EDF27_2810 [Curtobacterium sp. PhB136]